MRKLFFIFILIIVLFWVKDLFIVSSAAGKFVIPNYKFGENLGAVPHYNDTLVLFEDGSFKSKYYGKGSFVLDYSISGTQISLINGGDRVGLKTLIERNWSGESKILLDYDVNYYYLKID